MDYRKILALSAALMLSGSICSALEMSSSEILNIQGRVQVKKTSAGQFKTLNRNLRLAGPLKRLDSGDKVKTHLKSTAEMALKETCILAVKEQSLFEVPATIGQKALTQLKAQQGALLFKVISGNNFEVKTADVIAGVKGTLFELDVIDSFHSLLETPALELGVLTAGGTIVNVYKGEVELTHAKTGQKKLLSAGEGIAVLSDLSMKLSQLQTGFGEMRQFIPEQLLTQNYGAGSRVLLNTASTLDGLSKLTSLGEMNSDLGDNKTRLKTLFSGIKDTGIDIDGVDSYLDLIKDFADEKYKADFSRYRPQRSQFSVSENRFREVYIGHKAFAACKALEGSRLVKLEPTSEGLSVTDGAGSFKIIRFKGVKTDLEFMATYYESQGMPVTTVKLIKGQLYGRIPGELEYFPIPKHEASFVINQATNKGEWRQAHSGTIGPELNSYTFKAAEKFAKEKEAVDRKNTKKKLNGVKKLIKFKKFGF